MSFKCESGVHGKVTVQVVAWHVQHFTPIISEQENISKYYVSEVNSELHYSEGSVFSKDINAHNI